MEPDEKKRKASSPPPDEVIDKKKRRQDVETEMNELLEAIEEIPQGPNDIPRAMEAQTKARELAEEMADLGESEEEEKEEEAEEEPRKLTKREEKKKALAEKIKILKKRRILWAKRDHEDKKKKLSADLVASADVALMREFEREAEATATDLKDRGEIVTAPKSIAPFKAEIVRRAIEIWKNNTSIKWNPLEYHDCRTGGYVGVLAPPKEGEWKCASCARNVSVKRPKCQTCGGSASTAAPKMEACLMTEVRVRTFFLPSQRWSCHVCVEGMCAGDDSMSLRVDSHFYELEHDMRLFACETSGEPHLCGDDCDSDFLNDDHEYSCLLTGLCTKKFESRGDRWQPNKSLCDAWKYNPLGVGMRRRRRIDPKKESLQNLLDNEVLSESAKALQSGEMPTVREMLKEINPKEPREARRIAFSAVYMKILCVFSDDRFNNDAGQNARKRGETSNLLDKYLGRCEQQGHPPNASDMYTIVTARRLRTCYNPQVNLDIEDKSALAAYYAKKVILLWHTIVTKTQDGRTSPGRFQLDDFVTTALHLFHTGFEIPEDARGCRVQLILQDPLFAVFPITSWIEAKLHPRLQDSKKRNKSISRTKKAVQNALKGALEAGISPEDLKTERMSYLGMDETAFKKLKRS